MSWVATAVVGGAVIGGVASNRAAGKAADAQTASAQAGIAMSERQFDEIQKMLAPFRESGVQALGAQEDLLGLGGADAQAAAIEALKASPMFQSQLQQGEESILANASATGGLRGGNTQGALAQFSPALLSATISDQFNRLGGLSSMGLGAAGQTGQFAQAGTNNAVNLLQQQGAAGAGRALAQGQAFSNIGNSIGQGFLLNRFMQTPSAAPMFNPGVPVTAPKF